MNDAAGDHPEEQLADALAAYDDRLAAGITRAPDETQPAVEPALLADWHRLTAFLSLVEKAWPRGGDNKEDRTTTAEDRQAEPTRARPPLEHASGPRCEDSQRFGRFHIVQTLGQGGFGIVFLAGTRPPASGRAQGPAARSLGDARGPQTLPA